MKASLKTILVDEASNSISIQTSAPDVQTEAELDTHVEWEVVGLYPDFTYQTIEGFGCAMTETSCYLLSEMSPEQRTRALKYWFGTEGVDARFIRIPLDSCDFSLTEYQAVEDPIADPELETFSMERNRRYILPVVKEALELSGGKISALLSPWSPPSQWKTPPELAANDLSVYGEHGFEFDPTKPSRCYGGRLKKEYYPSWAKYLVKYVKAYLDEGIPVTMLSVQNEASAATEWDSCLWSGEEESIFLRDHLYPAMKEAGLTDKVGIFIWDHNKERMIEHIGDMMKNGIADLVEGFAYHWYTGDHFDALSMIGSHYPDKILLHSESCGLHAPYEPYIEFADALHYAHDMIGNINHGMNRWIDWNLCVDVNGGPRHVPHGFAAPLVALDNGEIAVTAAYEYIKLISQTFTPGSTRIGVTTFADSVEAAAAIRPDGNIGVALFNKNTEEQEVNIRFNGMVTQMFLPPKTLSSVVFEM